MLGVCVLSMPGGCLMRGMCCMPGMFVVFDGRSVLVLHAGNYTPVG